MPDNPSGGLLERLTLAEKLLAVASAAAILWTTIQSNRIANAVDEQEMKLSLLQETQRLEIERSKTAVELRDADVTLTHKIFEEFIAAITDKDSPDHVRVDRLSAVLVLADAIPNAGQKEGMLRAVKVAIERVQPATKKTRELVEAAVFDADNVIARASAEQRTISAGSASTPSTAPQTPGAPRWSNYDFDIFWCDGVPASTELAARAQEIAALRAADPKADGNWRVRALPAAVNERVGYQMSGYQIRYSSPDELPLAEALKRQMESRFQGVSVQISPSSQATPWYLSVFVCPSAA